ncbi:hypothetical protein B0H19DRAFT_1381163 [Mycena capillaripes]|nr:hypothetical protein B0H19DRAFT_1381163 [Mycena capillaripes]
MTHCRSLTAQESQNVYPTPQGHVSEFDGKNWLAEMIFAAKAMAAAAEFIQVPCLRLAFGVVGIFWRQSMCVSQTVLRVPADLLLQKIKRNREDLRELCASILDIVIILEEEIKIYGQNAAVRFSGLLEKFISFLRFHDIMHASRITDEITRYRLRLHELCSNFLLVAAIYTNLNVNGILSSVAGLQSIPQFRDVALGDINLLYQTAITNKIHKIKVFVAQISGEHTTMTVARYEDEPERWQKDLDLYSRFRHPHVWQLFEISTAPTFCALIFHGELMPLPIYRQFHRPDSDLVWSCVEAMLELATICVKREPISICLTLPGFDLEWEVDKIERMLSFWHSSLARQQVAPDHLKRISTIIADATPPQKIFEHFNWGQFFTVLTPAQIMWTTSWKDPQFFPGSVIRRPPQGSPSSPHPPHYPLLIFQMSILFE